MTRCSGVVALWMQAAGVAGSRPASMSCAASGPRLGAAHEHDEGVDAREPAEIGYLAVRGRPGAR